MKNILFAITLFFICIFTLSAQNLPSWIKKNMSEREIRQNLSGGEWGGNNNIYVYKFSTNLIYGFIIEPRKGLTRFSTIGNFDYNLIVRNFKNLYGEPKIFDSASVFFNNLPKDVTSIYVGKVDNFVSIQYHLDDLPSIKIINNTGYKIYHILISPYDDDKFGDDILGDMILLNGETFTHQLKFPFIKTYYYDVRLIDLDNDSYTKYSINVKDNTNIIFTSNDFDKD